MASLKTCRDVIVANIKNTNDQAFKDAGRDKNDVLADEECLDRVAHAYQTELKNPNIGPMFAYYLAMVKVLQIKPIHIKNATIGDDT